MATVVLKDLSCHLQALYPSATFKHSRVGNKTDISNNMKKVLIFLFLALLIAAGIGAYLWNKPHRTAEDEKPFATLTASALLNEFETNEAATTEKYRDKVIQISGQLIKASTDQSGNVQVVLEAGDELNTVSVTLMSGATAPTETPGTMIDVKGICNGFLPDELLGSEVLLNQGVVVNQTK